MTIDEMLARLRSVKPAVPDNLPDSVRRAAVLCLLYPSSSRTPAPTTPPPALAGHDHNDDDYDEDLNVILTLRSATMRSHAGDVSFPGGRQDDGEDSWTTALREANEEIGLPYALSRSSSGGDTPPVLQRICTLPPYLSKNNLAVTACVAYCPVDPLELGWRPTKSEAEVAEIFVVRLRSIAAGEGYEGRWMSWYDRRWRMHQFMLPGLPYAFSSPDDKRIWGLTARMLVDVARTAFACVPAYEHEEELGDTARIASALAEGTFGKQGVEERRRAEVTGEGQTRTSIPTSEGGGEGTTSRM